MEFDVDLVIADDGSLLLRFNEEIAAKFSKQTLQLIWLNPKYMGNWREAK